MLQTELASKESLLSTLTASEDDSNDPEGGEIHRLRLQIVSAKKDSDGMAKTNEKLV